MPVMNLFGAKMSKEAVAEREKQQNKELLKEWKKNMNSEMRGLDRQIMRIKREEEKVKREIKQLAAKNEVNSVKILVKNIVKSRKTTEKLYLTKTQMNSVVMELTAMAAQRTIADAMGQSAQIVIRMNQLVKVGEVSETMRNMQREMIKAGLIQEAVDEAMDIMDDDIEEDAEKETNAILEELALTNIIGLNPTANGAIGSGANANTANSAIGTGANASSSQTEQDKKEEQELMARMNAL